MMAVIRDGLDAAGISVWTDNNLKPGTPAWERAVQEAIETCSHFVVLLSPNAKESEWVNREIAYADQFRKTIIPVLISQNEKDSVPLRLVSHQRVGGIGMDRNVIIKSLTQSILPLEDIPVSRPPQKAVPPSNTNLTASREVSKARSPVGVSLFAISIIGLALGLAMIFVGNAAPGAIYSTAIGIFGTLICGPVSILFGVVGMALYIGYIRQETT